MGDVQGGASQEQFVPRDRHGVLFPSGDGGVAQSVENLFPVAIGLLSLDGVEAFPDDARQVADARVLLELSEQGLDSRHLVGEIVDFIDASVQQAVGFEEIASPGQVGLGDDSSLQLKTGGEAMGCVPGEFGRFSIHHHEDGFFEVGKFFDEGFVSLPGGQIRGDKTDIVRVDAQVEDGVDPEAEGQHNHRENGAARLALNKVDPACQDPGENTFDLSLHRVSGPASRVWYRAAERANHNPGPRVVHGRATLSLGVGMAPRRTER